MGHYPYWYYFIYFFNLTTWALNIRKRTLLALFIGLIMRTKLLKQQIQIINKEINSQMDMLVKLEYKLFFHQKAILHYSHYVWLLVPIPFFFFGWIKKIPEFKTLFVSVIKIIASFRIFERYSIETFRMDKHLKDASRES